MSKLFLASALATTLCASLAAQATQTPAPAPSAPPISQPRTGADTPQAPTPSTAQNAPRAAAKADSIMVEGCIQRSASGSATPGAAGTAGSASDSAFTLTSVAKPAGSSSAAAVASSYRLDADSSKLNPHVGHKVEISGTIEGDAKVASPKLKVDNVKMLAATCTP